MYIGKFLDGFDYGVRMLFSHWGIQDLPSPDCVSHRIHSFRNDGTPDNWFRPAVSWDRCLQTLCKNLGCRNCLTFVSSNDVTPNILQLHNCVLLGDVSLPASEFEIRDHFYHGAPGFLLYIRDENETVRLCNPLGCHWIESSNEEVALLLKGSSGFALWLSQRPVLHPVPKNVLRKEASTLRAEWGNFPENDFLSAWTGCKSDQIAFRYGLMNYQTRRYKAAEFYGLSQSFFSALSEIEEIYETLNFQRLKEIELLYWEELCAQKG